MSTTQTPEYVAYVKGLVRKHGGVKRAWLAYRESFEYFDGEVEIEAFYKRSFFAAARAGKVSE